MTPSKPTPCKHFDCDYPSSLFCRRYVVDKKESNEKYDIYTPLGGIELCFGCPLFNCNHCLNCPDLEGGECYE